MKNALLFVFFATSASLLQAAEFQLSTHVLDTSSGKPGPGVKVLLEKKASDGTWSKAGTATTDKDGRAKEFLEMKGNESNRGTYRLTFETGEYFTAKNQETVFPEAVVVFTIKDETHYHIPVVITPFAISTYRGS